MYVLFPSNSLNKYFNVTANKYETDVQLLQVLSKRIDCYEDIEELFSTLVDTLIHVLQCYAKSNNGELAETIITCVKNLLKLMMPVFKGNSGVSFIVVCVLFFRNILIGT